MAGAEKLILAWIPLFIAIDPLGLTAYFLGITHEVEKSRLVRIARQAILTAALVAIAFMFLGQAIFSAIGITISDFKIAGGIILLVLAIKDLVAATEEPKAFREDVGVVPLGMPLIAGPASITTLLILMDTVGLIPTLIALGGNLLLLYGAFVFSRYLKAWVGTNALRAFSKIISLLLAAIAVNMILKGFQGSLS